MPRQKRGIQYSAAFVLITNVSAYWIARPRAQLRTRRAMTYEI
jgi:hypothetical protein